ncbi:MAG: PDZ domain-containing protein, partial [Bacillota bacterium]|nr:PDZ domain-containing protein [Bacillota bacterium]
ERKNFHVRAFDAYFELRQLVPLGLVIGLGLSVLIVGAGLVVPFAVIVLIAFFTFLWNLTANIRLMAPAYTVGAAFFATIIIAERKWHIPIFTKSFESISHKVYPSVAVLLALLLLAEGILILKNGSFGTSPKLIKSKRGQRVGVHEVKRLWLLPVFLLIPGDALHLPFSWWPIFSLGGEKFSLLLVPFAIGFHQRIQSMLPKDAIQTHGKRLIGHGLVTLLLSIAGYWYPLASIATVGFAVIGREILALRQRMHEESLPFYFSKKDRGLMILGIIPASPAAKMGLQVGELITKVNGVNITNEKEFYEALQKNRAHCKLEVIDTNDQIRFVQRALYEGDHHELGILFVLDERKMAVEIG